LFSYSAFGMRIASFLELPELGALKADPDMLPDVLMKIAAVCPPSLAGGTWPAFIFSHGDSIFLSLDGAGRFEVRGGRQVSVEPDPRTDEANLRVYLTGMILGLLLYQRGQPVFHASVVESASGAIAFMGGKSAGKSTLAALLQQEGFGLLSDDILALEEKVAGQAAGKMQPPLALPGFSRLKLLPDTAHWLGREEQGARDFGKIPWPADIQFSGVPRPLRGVYLLEEGQPARLEPLAPGEAVKEILPHWYGAQFGLPAIEAVGRRLFLSQSAELARRVPIRRLVRPKDFSLTGQVARLLREDSVRQWDGAPLRAAGGRVIMKSAPRPLVSVIIPTRNRAAMLQEALTSVLGQELEEFEIIVIDDGSSQAAADLAQTILDPRIRWLSQERRGRSTARNRGMAEARGRYIALLDDDDLYLPGKLSSQTRFLESHAPIDLVASGTSIDHLGLGRLLTARPWLTHPKPTLTALLGGCRIHTCGIMFRRAFLQRMDPWFDPALALAEDLDFYLRAAAAGARMAWLPEIVAQYRLHADRGGADALGYMLSARAVLDRFYTSASGALAERLAGREAVFARHDFLTAMRAYGAGLGDLGRRFLEKAARVHRSRPAGEEDKLVAAIADYMSGEILDSRDAFVDLVLAWLPPPLAELARRREDILASCAPSGILPPASAVEGSQ